MNPFFILEIPGAAVRFVVVLLLYRSSTPSQARKRFGRAVALMIECNGFSNPWIT